MNNNFFIGIIVILMLIVLLQRSSCTPKSAPALPKTDTVTKLITVRDTIVGRPIFLKAKKDTIWKDSLIFKPDTNYKGLLKQYIALGDSHFTKNIYKTNYELDSFGTATIEDTVVANKLSGRLISYNLNIPTKTITITKTVPLVKQFYIGGSLYGNPVLPIRSAHVGLLYKDRQDRIFIGSIGFDGQIVYGFQSYWKIRLK
jgi:hypothetical protein